MYMQVCIDKNSYMIYIFELNIPAYIHTYNTHTHTHTHTHIYIYVCMYVCMCPRVCV